MKDKLREKEDKFENKLSNCLLAAVPRATLAVCRGYINEQHYKYFKSFLDF